MINKKDLIKTIIIMIIIVFVFFVIMTVLDNVLGKKQSINDNHEKLAQLLPNSNEFEKIYDKQQNININNLTNIDNNILVIYEETNNQGYVLEVKQQGFSDEMIFSVGINNLGYVTGLIYDYMGSNYIPNENFKLSIIGNNQQLTNINITSGATYSSNTIVNGIKISFNTLYNNNLLNKGGQA